MLEVIAQGILTGLVLATFAGPIFFAVINLGLRGKVKAAAYLAFGVFVSDILTVFFIYFLAKQIAADSLILKGMYVLGGGVLIYLGLQNLFSFKNKQEQENIQEKSDWAFFTKGFLINATNPNVFFFWFGAVMVAVQRYENKATEVLFYFISALLIGFATDFLKGYAASLLRPYIQENTLNYLSKFSGIVLIGFGVKLIFFH